MIYRPKAAHPLIEGSAGGSRHKSNPAICIRGSEVAMERLKGSSYLNQTKRGSWCWNQVLSRMDINKH